MDIRISFLIYLYRLGQSYSQKLLEKFLPVRFQKIEVEKTCFGPRKTQKSYCIRVQIECEVCHFCENSRKVVPLLECETFE